MPLRKSLTLPNGITCPEAFGVEDWNLQGSKSIAQVTITWWASQDAYAQGLPHVQVDPVLTFSPQEQQTGAAQLIDVLDALITSRPEYANATVIQV